MRDPATAERFRQESRVLAKLDHPNIAPVFDVGEQDGRLYFAMKLLEGPGLHRLIETNGRLSLVTARSIVDDVASALDYAAGRNIVHGDLKPGNILLHNDSAVLTDFGLARSLSATSLMETPITGPSLMGTPAYFPPEGYEQQELTGASDIYALGCILYEMLTGTPLFDGESLRQS